MRHLLFSLARASSRKCDESIIIFFNDYQKVNVNSIDINCLPSNIKLILLERNHLTKEFKKSLIGRMLLAWSIRGGAYTKLTKKLLINELFESVSINLPNESYNLFLFNDKNKMSRLFKLLNPSYEIIEDGVGNYIKVDVKGIKKYIRALIGKPKYFWTFGESSRCKKIHVTFPEKLPEEVKYKGVCINFLKNGLDLELINQVFKFTPKMKDNDCVIIATQPKSKRILPLLSGDDVFIAAYKEVESYCKSLGINVMVKLHPSEDDSIYKDHFRSECFLSTKHPLELELLNSTQEKTTIISINSSAGLGFEGFCTRKTLTKDGDIKDFCNSIVLWQKSKDVMNKQIQQLNLR